MSKRNHKPFETELKVFTIGTEPLALLGELVSIARSDLRPRDFAERHLVDELAISKWRILRVALMEKAVFEQQSTTFRPRIPKDANGNRLMPHEDFYHLAMAHTPESHAVVLAALSRLDARYARQFCNALRLLIALRRGNPPPAPKPEAMASAAVTQNLAANETRKEQPPCEPSPITPPAM